MRLVRRIAGAAALAVLRRVRRRDKAAAAEADVQQYRSETGLVERSDIEGVVSARVPADDRAELAVIVLFAAAALLAAAFLVAYIVADNTQLFGATLGGSFLVLAAALITAGKRVVPQDRLIERRPDLEPGPQSDDVAQMVARGGRGITRKRLLVASAGVAGASMGAALLAPAASLGPWIGDVAAPSQWKRGTALVDDQGEPVMAADLDVGSFLTAFATGADPEALASSLIVVRIDQEAIRVRPEWSPDGVMAFSKICTHAGCAVAMMRYPLYPDNAPGPALVCPCHYSTFDITHGGRVVFGPAGRPLPQLPLTVGNDGILRAGGNLSGQVGPGYGTVRSRRPL
jgi:ubiquinol-cytochrome c reductase iron-sulfur subunit